MAWYRTGTVAVTNGQPGVVGTGTEFAANVLVGDTFIGPDGRVYEIIGVASNTAMSIRPNYQGATATGQAYGVSPTGDWAKVLADRAATVLANWESSIGLAEGALQKDDNLAALTNRPQARQNLGLGSAATSNLDALLLKEGNLAGLVNVALARVNLGVVATEDGVVFNTNNCTFFSSEHGMSWRFEFGFQLCIMPISVLSVAANVVASTPHILFPQKFIGLPCCDASVSAGSSIDHYGAVQVDGDTDGVWVNVRNGSMAQNFNVHPWAIGWWK